MSICSDVYITKVEACKRVKSMLMYEQETLIDKAMEAMNEWDLVGYLNRDSDLIYYNIESNEEEER